MTRNELQQQIISNLILDDNLYFQYSDQLQDFLFSDNDVCIKIFRAFANIIKDNKKPDIILLAKNSGLKFTDISELIQAHNTNILFENALLFLNTESLRQRLRDNLINYTFLIDQNDPLEAIAKIQKDINEMNVYNTEKINNFSDEIDLFLNHIENTEQTGLNTGFSYLNKITNGLQPSDFIVLAAETSQGKTSLALNIAASIAANGHPGMMASYEMSNSQLVGRILSSETNIPLKLIYKKQLCDYDLASFTTKVNSIRKYPIYIYDIKNNSINNLCNSIRRHALLFGIKYAVIDYLQLIRLDGTQSREQEVGTIGRMLKNLAKELNICIIALSQLNRAKDPLPTLSRLRDSGQIEEAADIVLFIFRQEEYLEKGYEDTYKDGNSVFGLAKIIIAKGRNIGTGEFYLNFNKELTKFSNYDSPGTENATF